MLNNAVKHTVIQFIVLRVFLKMDSEQMLNKYGESMQPCLTPLFTETASEVACSSLTSAIFLDFDDFVMSYTFESLSIVYKAGKNVDVQVSSCLCQDFKR